MDIKFMMTTFGLVFLAELGDKTQLATFCLSADCESSKWSVFIGSAGALVIASLIAVFFCDAISRIVPLTYIRIGAGVFFLGVGAWMLLTSSKAVCSL